MPENTENGIAILQWYLVTNKISKFVTPNMFTAFSSQYFGQKTC